MQPLSERMRPRTFADIVGQARAVRTVRRTLERSWAGRAFWVTGPSGAGKTSLARLIAAHGAEPWSITEIDAQDVSLDFCRDMGGEMMYRGIGGKDGKAFIVNEAHTLRSPIVSRLLTLLERPGFLSHCCFVFTLTNAGHDRLFDSALDAAPLMSRCVQVPLVADGSNYPALAVHVHRVAKAEGINLSLAECQQAVKAANGNLRAIWQQIDSGVLEGCAA